MQKIKDLIKEKRQKDFDKFAIKIAKENKYSAKYLIRELYTSNKILDYSVILIFLLIIALIVFIII